MLFSFPGSSFRVRRSSAGCSVAQMGRARLRRAQLSKEGAA
jgi:hypothetical protein